MNPIPLTVFATLAGLSLASLALLPRSQDKDDPTKVQVQKKATKFSELTGVDRAMWYLFMSLLISILGLVGSAVLGNIGNFNFLSENCENLTHILDNIFAFICLFVASGYIWGGAGYIVANKWYKEGKVALPLAKRIGLGWIIGSITNYILNPLGNLFTKDFFNKTESKPDKKTENKQKTDT